MKRISINVVFVLACVALFASCGGAVSTGKPGSSGKTLELLLVANNNVYSSTTKMIVDSIFTTPQYGLAYPEPRFDMVNIAPSQFEKTAMFQAHRNILILETGVDYENLVYLENDKWSTPQVVIRITAKNRELLDSLLLVHAPRLLKEYYNMEYARMEKVFGENRSGKIINYLDKKYGFSLTFPEEFVIAKKEESFTWIRKEAKEFGLQFYVSMAPYKDDSQLTEAYILNNLDTMMKRYVPGPAEGSYQGTERRDFFYTAKATLAGQDAVETRGRWRTFGDYMGGPFVCYTLLTPDGSNVVTLVGCVYSPSQRNKMIMPRDLLMQLDGICHSIKFNN